MRYYKLLLLALLLSLWGIPVHAQKMAIKTNALYDGTTTLSAELEFATGKKTSLSLLGAYNPWTFRNDKMMHLGAVQPAFRYWFCERFEGHFVGIHVHEVEFFGNLKSKRYDGHLVGTGISWGYDWILSNHWNIEAEVGFGINWVWFKESECIPCMKDYVRRKEHFFSPTRIALSIVYVL